MHNLCIFLKFVIQVWRNHIFLRLKGEEMSQLQQQIQCRIWLYERERPQLVSAHLQLQRATFIIQFISLLEQSI